MRDASTKTHAAAHFPLPLRRGQSSEHSEEDWGGVGSHPHPFSLALWARMKCPPPSRGGELKLAFNSQRDSHHRRRCTRWRAPFLASRLPISNSRVVRMRAPDAPMGWPMAMAAAIDIHPGRIPAQLLFTAQAWAAKASLAFHQVQIARLPARLLKRRAGRRGSGLSPSPWDRRRPVGPSWRRCGAPRGVRPRALASLALISTRAAAPSLRPDALPAVDRAGLVEGSLRPPPLHRSRRHGYIRHSPPPCRPCGS